jgi:hypothetical protein
LNTRLKPGSACTEFFESFFCQHNPPKNSR